VFAYSGLEHRHNAEVAEQWRRWSGAQGPLPPPRVLVHAGPFVRGIYLTLHARLDEPRDALTLYRTAYAGRPFVRVAAKPPQLTHAVGTNDALLHAALSDDGAEVEVSVAIDNLVKGAAGQAIQAMNLALGLTETAGLRLTGFYPC
jgi:N-acetyl-gamma-glutamyl-phosphate reductase